MKGFVTILTLILAVGFTTPIPKTSLPVKRQA
jgi:hypothetical protein